MELHNYDYFISKYPSLDLHGENTNTVGYLLNSFIEYNYILRNENVIIIHGIGRGILRKEVSGILKNNKKVSSYKTGILNPGLTVVKLMLDK